MAEAAPQPQDFPPRHFGRMTLGIPATLDTIHGRKHVRLVDLSQGGAHVVLPQVFAVRDCVLNWLGFEAFCMHAWHEGNHLGLSFETPLPLAPLVATRNAAPEVIRAEASSVESAARAWADGSLSLGVDR